MADAKELLKDIELTDDVKEKIVSAINPVLTNYESQLSNEAGKLKEAIATRDAAKEKNRELEAKLATGNTQIEELLGAKNKEIESLSKTNSDLTTERDSLKTFAEAVNKDRKQELLDKLPEGKLRETASKINDLPLLKEHVEAVLESLPDKGGSFNGRGGGKGKLVTDGKGWDDFTNEQRKQIRESNRAEYDRMYRKRFGFSPR